MIRQLRNSHANVAKAAPLMDHLGINNKFRPRLLTTRTTAITIRTLTCLSAIRALATVEVRYTSGTVNISHTSDVLPLRY